MSVTASWASASTVITEPFSTPGTYGDNNLPAGWTASFYQGTAPAWNGPIAVEAASGNNYLRLIRASGSGASAQTTNNSAFYYTGSSGDISGGVLGDFSASLIVRTTQISTQVASSQGVAVGAKSATYAYSGYYVAYTLTGLSIYQNPTSHTANGTLRDSVTFTSSLTASVDYSLRVSVTGNIISAALWSVDGNTEYGSVTYTDPSLQPITGLFGLRSAFGNGDIKAFYRDLELTANAPASVPEPASTALIVVMLAGLGGVVMRMRKRN